MKKLLLNPFLKGSVYLTAATFVIGLLNYIFNVVAGRILGPEGYGNVTTLFAYLSVLTIPLAAISNVLIQRIGKHDHDKESYAWSIEDWSYRQIKKYWWLLLAPLVFTPLMPGLTNITPVAAYSIMPIFLISIYSALYDGILTGLQRFLIISIIAIISVVVKLAGALLGQYTPDPLLTVVLLFNLSYIVKIVLDKYWLQTYRKATNTVIAKKIEKTVFSLLRNKQFLLTVGSIFSMSVITNFDMMFAKKVFSAEYAGYYAGWALFAKVIIYMFAPLLTMSYVFFSNKKEGVHHHIVLILSLLFLAMIGFGLNIGYGMYDQFLIEKLLGQKYLALKPFLEWSALFGIAYVMVMFLNNYFLAKESRVTLILPVMTVVYIPTLIYYVDEFGMMIYFTTTFMFAVLVLYLLAFMKDKVLSLFE